MNYQTTKQAEPEAGEQSASIEVHLTSVYRFCLRLCGGKTADAEDLTQDVFVQAWQHRADFAGRSKVTTWLMRIALNRHLRVRAGQGRTQDFPEVIETAATPDPATGTLERLELTRALDGLPDNLRTAFLLVKVEGCKYREAADILGVPVGTVQWQVHEAVQRLRTTLLADSPAPHVLPADTRPAAKEATHAV